MSRWQAIVFDLDDTLYPEHEYVKSGFAAVAAWAVARFGIAEALGYQKFLELFTAGIRGDTFNRWLCAFGLPAEHVSEMVAIYRTHRPQIKPFAFIPGLLQRLATYARLGLVSDGYLGVQQRKWEALALAPYFSAVVFSDQWGQAHWKPSPTPFLAVLAQLNTSGRAAVYIGDNPRKDFLGARRAEMATIWARYTQGEYAGLMPSSLEHAPDFVIANEDELLSLLLSGGST